MYVSESMTHTCILTSTSLPDITFVDSLKSMDVLTIHAPALSVDYTSDNPPLPFIPRTLIITSKHSLRNINAYALPSDIPVLCVGETTRQACTSLGFKNVFSAFEDGSNLISYIQDNALELSDILYPRGKDVQTDLKAVCTALNINIHDPIAYKTSFATEWNQEAASLLKDNNFNVLCVFSSRGAKSLSKIIEQYALQDYTTRTNLLCLSDRMLKYLDHFQWRSCSASKKPTQQSFLDKVEQITQMES